MKYGELAMLEMLMDSFSFVSPIARSFQVRFYKWLQILIYSMNIRSRHSIAPRIVIHLSHYLA